MAPTILSRSWLDRSRCQFEFHKLGLELTCCLQWVSSCHRCNDGRKRWSFKNIKRKVWRDIRGAVKAETSLASKFLSKFGKFSNLKQNTVQWNSDTQTLQVQNESFFRATGFLQACGNIGVYLNSKTTAKIGVNDSIIVSASQSIPYQKLATMLFSWSWLD